MSSAAAESGPSLDIVGARVRFLEIADGVLTLRVSLRSRWWWVATGGVALLVGLACSAAAWFHRSPSAAFRAEHSTSVVKTALGSRIVPSSLPRGR